MANRIFIPTLVIIFLIIVIRAVTLPGAADGLQAFFQPDFNAIFSGEVWVAAYGQIFFSLSIAFAIMITYSSYLPKKADITNNAFITGFSNSSFELLAGIGVFAALGFMASQAGVGVEEVVAGGVGLAFVVFPQIINEFPALSGLFGFLFFVSLVLAGLSSLISISETYVKGFAEKFGLSRKASVAIGGGIAAVISLLYATNGGLYFLDTIDYFINQFGVALVGLIEVVAIAWFMRKLGPLSQHANRTSDIQIGTFWKVCLGLITPLVLGYMMFDLFRQNLLRQFDTPTGNYEGYSDVFITYSGWGVAFLAFLIGVILTVIRWKNKRGTDDYKEAL